MTGTACARAIFGCTNPATKEFFKWAGGPGVWLCGKHWYDEYLNTSHWERLREQKLRVAGRRCERCGTRAHRTFRGTITGLQVHHRTYERLGAEHLEDLEVLCEICHKREHRR